MRIGLLGGTFDPIHNAHLALADAARKQLELDRVIFIPALHPPHKGDRPLTEGDKRLEMVRLAIRSSPFFQASDLELRRSGPSYTVDTLREFHHRFPDDATFFLIMGSDSLGEFKTWYQWEEILKLSTLAVAVRPGFSVSQLPKKTVALTMPPMEISASTIRAFIREGKHVAGLVPDPVREFILLHQLYT